MKFKKIIIPAVVGLLVLSGCDDNKMEWVSADGSVSLSDIPLELAEKIANYDYIKAYAQQYTPNMTIGLGLGADEYISDDAYRAVCDANYQTFVTGNAMKHQSVVGNSGAYTFTTIDNFLDLVPSDVDVYGHNFIWHTQQNQTYLKSLIAPTMNVVTDGGGIANILSGDNSDFNGGTKGDWGQWGGNSSNSVEEGLGPDGSACLVLVNPDDGNMWDCQCAIDFADPLTQGETYVVKFEAKCDGAGQLQCYYQNSATYGSQVYGDLFEVTSTWTTFEWECEMPNDDDNRLIINFGAVAGTYYIDNIEFGLKVEDTDPMINIVTNSDFEDGTTTGWTGLWGNYTYDVASPGYNSDYCLHFEMTDATTANWDCQLFWPLSDPLEAGVTYSYSFWAKSDSSVDVQFMGQNDDYSGQIYKDVFTTANDWTYCEGEFTCSETEGDYAIIRVGIQFGGTPQSNLWVDDIKFGEKIDTGEAKKLAPQRKATTITYTIMPEEQKKEALLGAMEDWIKTISEHIRGQIGDRLIAWDVINEPITDNGGFRGIDGFGGTDDDGNNDTAPVETEEDGLTLNWANGTGNGHFYWGYYLGMDYAVKAFEYARQYNPNALLFVNDYNLETSPSKLAKLIEFVDYIDNNGTVKVDGIGTQMHVTSGIDEESVRTMFSTLAATGKKIRVTELDVAVNTSSPSAEQLEEQADTYEMIVKAYKELIPADQQSGITVWTLSDAAAEHEYWLNGDSPNLFDSNYDRKHAYKGFCDGLAGFDISETLTGEDWRALYEEEETAEETTEVSSEE